MALLIPTPQTLKRYGLSYDEWLAMADAQNHRCAICRLEPTKQRLCIDHEHVRGWAKMPPDERKRYVRALLCWVCNHYYMGRGISIAKAQRVVDVLTAYEARKAKPLPLPN